MLIGNPLTVYQTDVMQNYHSFIVTELFFTLKYREQLVEAPDAVDHSALPDLQGPAACFP